VHRDAFDVVLALGGRDDPRIQPARSHSQGEVPQVELDTTHARQEPVAGKRDAHGGG